MDLKLSTPTNDMPPLEFNQEEFDHNFEYFDAHDLNSTPEEINQMFVGLLYNIYFLLMFKHMSFFSRAERWTCAQYILEELYCQWRSDCLAGKPIQSIKGYTKAVLPAKKAEWLRWEKGWHSWQKVIDGEFNFQRDTITPLAELLADETDDFSELEFSHSISQIYLTAKNIVKTVPAENKAERRNIYISCLLTLFYKITYANSKFFKKDTVILFRLNNYFKPRIMILVKQIEKALVRDLCYQTQMHIHSSDLGKLLTSLEMEGRDDY